MLVKPFKMKEKNKKEMFPKKFISMLLGTLRASLLGNLLTGKVTIRASKGTIRTGEILPPHPLTNFKIQKYYENEPKFNGAYSRNNLSKIKAGTYIINLD